MELTEQTNALHSNDNKLKQQNNSLTHFTLLFVFVCICLFMYICICDTKFVLYVVSNFSFVLSVCQTETLYVICHHRLCSLPTSSFICICLPKKVPNIPSFKIFLPGKTRISNVNTGRNEIALNFPCESSRFKDSENVVVFGHGSLYLPFEFHGNQPYLPEK